MVSGLLKVFVVNVLLFVQAAMVDGAAYLRRRWRSARSSDGGASVFVSLRGRTGFLAGRPGRLFCIGFALALYIPAYLFWCALLEPLHYMMLRTGGPLGSLLFFLHTALSFAGLLVALIPGYIIVARWRPWRNPAAFASDSLVSEVARLLRLYIRDNGLFEEERSGDDAVVVSSIGFDVSRSPDGGSLLVSCVKTGDRWTDRAGSQGPGLAALLAPFELVETADYPDRCTYRFRVCEEERLDAYGVLSSAPTGGMSVALTGELDYRPDKTPHVLVCGGTGGGKSRFLFYLIGSFWAMGTADGMAGEVYVCDPKNAELASFGHFMPADHVAVTPGQIAGAVRRVSQLMEDRYAYMNDPVRFEFGKSASDHGLHPVLLVIDEFAALRAAADKKAMQEIDDGLKQLILKGRAANVTVCLCLQQPNAGAIGTDLRDNLGLRVSLGSLSREGYAMCYGAAASGYDFGPVDGPGTGYIYIDGMKSPRRFAAPVVDTGAHDFMALLSDLCKGAEGRNATEPVNDTGEGEKSA